MEPTIPQARNKLSIVSGLFLGFLNTEKMCQPGDSADTLQSVFAHGCIQTERIPRSPVARARAICGRQCFRAFSPCFLALLSQVRS